MSDKIAALRIKDVTPEMVLQNLIEENPKHVMWFHLMRAEKDRCGPLVICHAWVMLRCY